MKNKISIGQQFHLEGIGNYLLATPDGESVCLIHIASGNRLANAVKVEDRLSITKAEFKLISQSRPAKLLSSFFPKV